MAGFFNLPSAKSVRKKDMATAKKSKTSKSLQTVTIKGGGSLIDKIQSIVSVVNSKFEKKKDEFLLIRSEPEFIQYMDKCIANNIISIDTETTGLDPIENHIVGLCIYTPGEKAAYVPINHISYITQARVENQLNVDFLREQLQRLVDANVRTYWFNAPFDVRFIGHTIGIWLPIYWDASIASRVLNSNEPRGCRGLKPLHKKYCRNNEGEAFSFDKLFEGIPFNLIPVKTAYLYAANDAVITYELAQYQEQYLDPESPLNKELHLEGLSYVFFNVEMASMPVFIEMEENGVTIDMEYAKTISKKYHEYSEKTQKRAMDILNQYKDEIEAYRRSTPGCKLTDPVNLDSPTQLAILLYDVFKVPPVDKRNPRGTGAEILEKIDHPLVSAILDNRFFNKQLSTYVDKIPELVHADGRVHCKFNQYGADCVIGESLLLTSKGYCRIDSLFTGQEENGKFYDCDEIIYNKNIEKETASAKIVFYNTPTYKITLRGGYTIEGTPNHPIICSQLNKDDIQRNKSNRQLRRLTETQEFRKLENIKIGDIVAIPYGYNIFPTEYIKTNLELFQHSQMKSEFKMPTILNEEFAEFLGMYFADGSYSFGEGTFRISITNKNKEVIDRFKYLVTSLFGVHCINEPEKHSITTAFSSLAHKHLVKYLNKGARNKKIHQDVMNSPKSVICAFIKGMTLDSSINLERQEFELNCVDRVSNAFVKQVLANIGILTAVKRDYYFEGKDHCGNDVPKIRVERICIKGEMYKKFLDEIGVIESKKFIESESFTKTWYLCNSNYYYAYVTKIEQGLNNVYDLTVPGTHSFICEGFLNHNTGRTSSDSPNLQNIPSRPRKLTTGEVVDAGHDVRQFFSAAEGKVLLSCDYSGQEVRVTAHISHDQKMIKAYQDGKDVYVEIASLAYNVPYEECLENRPDGTTNPEGKARRGSAKSIVLGILYGRQVASIAEQLNTSTQDAQRIYDKVLASFPELAQFIRESEEMARKNGWVETVWGRRRQLPEMQLPLYEFSYMDGVSPDFDPLADDDEEISTEVPYSIVKEYTTKLQRCRGYRQKMNILESLNAQGITVKDNSMKIGDAQRQCVNCVDFETEILTTTGWKKYSEVKENDSILSYHMEKNQITLDTVKQVHIYEGIHDVVRFKHSCFDAMSTPEHRWVCQQQNHPSRFVTTQHICKNKWPDYPILKIADNSFEDNTNISDLELKLLGWLMTDGSYTPPTKPYHMNLYQGTHATKNLIVYNEMISVLNELGYFYNDMLRDTDYHDIYINKCPFTDWVRQTFPDRVLTFEFISTLSMRQARILVDSMIQGDGTTCDGYTTLCCRSLEKVNVFQYLCCIAGYATNYHICDDNSICKHYGNVPNKEGYIETKNIYYNVSILRRKKAHIYPEHRTLTQTDGVWCVTTGNGTWIARRHGCVYITGNSRVQGSAADLTKLAMIELYNCQELRDLGFKMLIPVHDEIIAECPVENSGKCAELMSEMMLNAGKDLCVPLKCDTDAFYHWYGDKLDPVTLEPLGH